MLKKDYIKLLRSHEAKRRRRTSRRLLAWFVAVLILFLLQKAVSANWTGFSKEVNAYLWDTLFYDFSMSDLRQLAGGDATAALAVYSAFHVLLVLTMLAAIFYFISRLTRAFREEANARPERGLLMASDCREALERYLNSPQRKVRRKLSLTLQRADFASLINPMRWNWQKRPTMQWLRFSILPTQIRSILQTVTSFDRALWLALGKKTPQGDLAKLDYPLLLLEEFFYVVATRVDPRVRAGQVTNGQKLTENGQKLTEQELLAGFARHAKPLVISILSRRKGREDDKWWMLERLIRPVYRSPVARNVSAVAMIAGVIMVLGVLVFRITPQQAFLTWFAACFGSITISMVVARLHDQEKAQQSPAVEPPNQSLHRTPTPPSRGRRR